MKLSRPSRIGAALIALFSMLFMQYAVASYVCSGMRLGQGQQLISMATNPGNADMQGMSGCAGMDANQPGLCHAYGHTDNQSFDKPGLPHVQPFIASTVLTVVFNVIAYADEPIAAHPDSLLLMRATAPPLSIRNCCFRI